MTTPVDLEKLEKDIKAGVWFRRELVEAIAELRAAREIIAKLPQTADGVPITPGMNLCALSRDFPIMQSCRTFNCVDWDRETPVIQVLFQYEHETFERQTSFRATELYSTRELAEAALTSREAAESALAAQAGKEGGE